MTGGQDIILVFCFAVITALTIVLIIAVIRWILRINAIVDHLTDISKTLKNIEAFQTSSKVICDVCDKKWPYDKLKTIESGQSVCPNCLRNMSAK